MNNHYSHRPFADDVSGSPVSDALSALAVRSSGMFVAGVALTTAVAAVFAH